MSERMQRLLPIRWRAAALLPASVLTVHQLRYQLAFGHDASGELARQGHAYLGILAPVAGLLVAFAAGLFGARLLEALRSERDVQGCRLPLLRVWLAIAAALLLIYAGQELLEGVLAPGHPVGLAGVFGSGGLLAIPLSAGVGAVCALLLRGATSAIAWASAQGAFAARRRPRSSGLRRRTPIVRLPRQAPLATAAAGRAPPAFHRL